MSNRKISSAMETDIPRYKTIKLRPDKWAPIKELAVFLSEERGVEVSIPQAVSEAVKFMSDHAMMQPDEEG